MFALRLRFGAPSLLLLPFVFPPSLAAEPASAARALPFTPRWEYRVESENPRAEKTKGDWQAFTSNSNFSRLTGRSSGVLQVRTRFLLRKDLPAALYLGRVSVAEEVYLNGVRIGQAGRFPSQLGPSATDYFSLWNQPRGYLLPESLLFSDSPNVLQMRIYWNVYGYVERAELMTEQNMQSLLLRDRMFHYDLRYGLIFILFSVAVYYFLLFVKRRRDRENLLFALTCVAAAVEVSNFCFPDLGVDWLNKERFFFGNQPILGLFFALFFLYFFALTGRLWRIAAWVIVVSAVLASAWIVTAPDIAEINHRRSIVAVPIFLALAFTMAGTIAALRARHRNARAVAIGFVFVWILAVHDIVLVVLKTGNPVYLFSYALPLFLGNLALIQANDFFKTRNQIEELNEHLEEKVEQRTEELQETLNQVQELKTQQDGDYFLTSLLIGPLSSARTRDPRVQVETLVRQKKSFQFRRWTADLGGDLCSAAEIGLRGREYTVILNGDAMGKSIQGAGGALVLGTVFKSIITRTQDTETMSSRPPELWLKDTFSELQNVFVAFDGLMLISVVVALVDRESGTLYFINAEHPSPVLLRRGVASFLEEEIALRKIGIMDVTGDLVIRTFRLLPEDLVFLGSDGRDDIVLGHDLDGRRQINENELLFLRSVEDAGGSLDRIFASLNARGELMDDLSLVRVGYREDSARPDDTGYDVGPSVLEARALLKKREFSAALNTLEPALEAAPYQSELLHLASMALKGERRLAEAVELAERFRLRQPQHAGNLINLADLYRLSGNVERARSMLERVERNRPGHPSARRIRELLSTSL